MSTNIFVARIKRIQIYTLFSRKFNLIKRYNLQICQQVHSMGFTKADKTFVIASILAPSSPLEMTSSPLIWLISDFISSISDLSSLSFLLSSLLVFSSLAFLSLCSFLILQRTLDLKVGLMSIIKHLERFVHLSYIQQILPCFTFDYFRQVFLFSSEKLEEPDDDALCILLSWSRKRNLDEVQRLLLQSEMYQKVLLFS